MQLSRCNIFFPFVDLVPHLHVYVVFFAKLRTFIFRNFPNNAQTQKDNCGVIVLIDKPPCGSIFQVRLFHNIAELNITVDWMNSKATCMYQHICVFICLVCVCVCVRVHLGVHHSVKDILAPCLRSLWSQGAVDCPTGRQEEGAQLPYLHTQNTHCIETITHTHTHSLTPVTDRSGTQIRLHEPPRTVKKNAHAHSCPHTEG